MNRLHPLHTPELVAEHLRNTGCYLGDRRTGKTTAACLLAIAKAIKTPHKYFVIEDPDMKTTEHQREVLRTASDLAGRMGLEHLQFEIKRLDPNSTAMPTVMMERRTTPTAAQAFLP